MYQLKSTQKLATDMETAWEFLSNPENLAEITPDMGFKILSGADKAMVPGQIIQYKVSPFPGIRTTWVTEITHVKDKNYFVDEQRFGPYRFWHHKHFIKESEDGVVMEDIVDYKIPLGILGRFAHFLFIKKKLYSVFEYRKNKLAALFGEPGDKNTFITIRKIK